MDIKKALLGPIGLTVFLFFIAAVFSVEPLLAQDRNTDNSTNNNSTNKTEQDQDFQPKAKWLSLDLMKQVGFSLEKAIGVRDILIDYNRDIAEARNNYRQEKKETSSETGSMEDSNAGGAKIDGILGYDVGIYYKDSSPDLMEAYKEADRRANDKIVNILSDENTKKYEQIKDKWWKKVKDEVFSPYYSHMNGKMKTQK